VLGVFFLLVWVTVIAALTSHDRSSRARLLLPGQVDDEFKGAMLRHDHAQLARYYRIALGRSLPARDEQLIRINLACALNGLGEHPEALEELDRVALGELQPAEVALWLNNRAYTLIFLNRAVDALDNLSDAEELLAGDDTLGRDPLLSACISGTRGIALLHNRELEAGEKALLLALRQEEDGVALQFDPEWQVDPARTAERWYWLGEIARERGDVTEARRRFERASAHSVTEFGSRAKKSLAGLLEPTAAPRGLLPAATVNPVKTPA
jgi:tetratricopeptide (TPR) repeat protein